MRIVSVLPSATEIVFALGRGDDLVGRSAECDFPEAVRSRPVVMYPRTLDADAPSGEIDARVAAARGRGESLYRLDTDRLRALRPDLLLTQDLCGVCSVTGDEVERACRAAGIRPTVVSLSPRRLDDVWGTVETIGSAVDAPEAGAALATSLRRRATAVDVVRRPRVAVVEWTDPPILAGLWTPEIVRAAGGEPIGPTAGEPGVRTTWAELSAAGPDLVVVAPCSFSVDRAGVELDRPGTRAEIAAARLAPPLGLHLADEAYFSRPGPRLADGIDLLRHLLRGTHWTPPMPVRAVRPAGAVA